MRALVIGAGGFLGGHLIASAPAAGITAIPAQRHAAPPTLTCDLLNPASVRRAISASAPDVVVLPAALPNVEACESDPLTEQVNAHGPAMVADVCASVGCRLVFFSSDYVFDGRAGPYREGDAPAPIQAYGRQKLAAERAIAARLAAQALILRVTVVFGREPAGKNFAMRLLSALRRGERVRVPSDQVGSPTLADDLAAATWTLAERGAGGVLHCAGSTLIDRATFAVRLAERFGLDAGLIDAVATASLGQRAPRPLRAGMISSAAESVLGRPMLSLDAALERFRHALERP